MAMTSRIFPWRARERRCYLPVRPSLARALARLVVADVQRLHADILAKGVVDGIVNDAALIRGRNARGEAGEADDIGAPKTLKVGEIIAAPAAPTPIANPAPSAAKPAIAAVAVAAAISANHSLSAQARGES